MDMQKNKQTLPWCLRKHKGGKLEYKFEWLTLAELHQVYVDHKELRDAIHRYFQQNYSNTHFICRKGNIYSYRPTHTTNYKMNGFSGLISWMTICNDEDIEFVKNNCYSLENVAFYCDLKAFQTKSMKNILEKLVTVEMDCDLFCDFHDFFLEFCPNLKHLTIGGRQKGNILIGTTNKWLLNEYPTIEYFELDYRQCDGSQIDEIKIFFEKNPNIRTFATDLHFLRTNKSVFMEFRTKFDVLSITNYSSLLNYDELHNLLIEFRKIGFYKRLCLNLNFAGSENSIEKLTSISELEILFYSNVKSLMNRNMDNLRAIYLYSHYCSDHNGSFVKNVLCKCPSLERIGFLMTNFRCLYELVCNFPNLKSIKMKMYFGAPFTSIDISMLNDERKRLAGPSKIIIYVEEGTFLETKSASPNGITNLSLVQLKRSDSYEWTDHICNTLKLVL